MPLSLHSHEATPGFSPRATPGQRPEARGQRATPQPAQAWPLGQEGALAQVFQVSTMQGWAKMFPQGTPLGRHPRDSPTFLDPYSSGMRRSRGGCLAGGSGFHGGCLVIALGQWRGQWCLSGGPPGPLARDRIEPPRMLVGSNLPLGLLPSTSRLLRRRWSPSLAGLLAPLPAQVGLTQLCSQGLGHPCGGHSENGQPAPVAASGAKPCRCHVGETARSGRHQVKGGKVTAAEPRWR